VIIVADATQPVTIATNVPSTSGIQDIENVFIHLKNALAAEDAIQKEAVFRT
jgi:hypothetical protein